MGHKQRTTAATASTVPKESPPGKPRLVANPPRRNKPFLIVSAVLLAAWMAVLAVLALITRQ